MKFFVLPIVFFLLTGSNAFAVREGGGGDGYVASFKHTALDVYGWLKGNGKFLNPPVDPDQFIFAVDPNRIISVAPGDKPVVYADPVTHKNVIIKAPFTYKGNPRDCLYFKDIDITAIDRQRWDSVKPDSLEMWRGVSHEIFRRMGLEGDGFEISSQVVRRRFSPPDISFFKAGDFISDADNTAATGNFRGLDPNVYTATEKEGDCYRHVEIDYSLAKIVTEIKSRIPGRSDHACDTAGGVHIYICSATDNGVLCDETAPYYYRSFTPLAGVWDSNPHIEALQLLPDGNFTVTDTGYLLSCMNATVYDCSDGKYISKSGWYSLTAKFHPVTSNSFLEAHNK